MSGYCVMGEHGDCPDSQEDMGICSCPCHLQSDEEEQDVT